MALVAGLAPLASGDLAMRLAQATILLIYAASGEVRLPGRAARCAAMRL
jgi:hypothetical protein